MRNWRGIAGIIANALEDYTKAMRGGEHGK